MRISTRIRRRSGHNESSESIRYNTDIRGNGKPIGGNAHFSMR